MLPRNPSLRGGETFRYVDSSIFSMMERFRALGIRKNEMEVKLFGGADVLKDTAVRMDYRWGAKT